MGKVRNFAEILHRLATNWVEPEFDTSYGDSELMIAWRKPLPDTDQVRQVWLECDTFPTPGCLSLSCDIVDGEGRYMQNEVPTFWLELLYWDGTLPPEFVEFMDAHFKREG